MIKLSLKEIGHVINGNIVGDPSYVISNISSFKNAQKNHITFADNPKFLKQINLSRAGAIIIPSSYNEREYKKNFIKVSNPKIEFSKLILIFNPEEKIIGSIHETSFVEDSAKIDSSSCIGPLVHIGKRVKIGKNSVIKPGTFIADDVVIGANTIIYPNVTVMNKCKIGNDVIIHSGTVIGSDGFGFTKDGDKYHKIPHVGIVQIDDNVEIGACNTIDKATMGKTWIKSGVKTDNIVHIGHNVTINENTIIIANVAIGGSSIIGRNAILAGKVGISDHIKIGNNVKIGPGAGVLKDVAEGKIISGFPSMPHKKWLRVQQVLGTMPNLSKIIKQLKEKIMKLEDKLN